MTAEQFIKAVQSKGCDATDVRDAAHEACHAKQTHLRKPWTRDNVHEAVERLAKANADPESGRGLATLLVRYELQARAVELLACKYFGIKYDIEHWALICWMETSKAYQLSIGDVDDIVEAVRETSKQLEAKMLLGQVLRIRA